MRSLLIWGLILCSLAAQGAVKKVTLITMEIPPFMSPKMPDQGAAIYALRAMFRKAGYELEMRFVPVPRMRQVGFGDDSVHGFFPSFAEEKFDEKLVLSKLFYKTPWVIVERKDKPILWKESRDLLKYKGGNVAGYVLRSQVADAYKDRMDRLETAKNDTLNLLKLIHKRVDFIFIDQNAFKFIARTNAEIAPHADKLAINPNVVALNSYGVDFKDNKISRKIMADFNAVVDEKEFTDLVTKYIEQQKSPPVQQSKGMK